jgi:glycosyltransferase involved in cell wall biosynthesis
MRIALVHEFLNQLGGAERVLENFFEIWPDATLHVLLYDEKKTEEVFGKYRKKVSFVDKLPFIKNHSRLFLPLMPFAIERFNFKDYDVVFSDSSSFAKGAKSRGKLHICYCHTPTRFLWMVHDYIESQPYPRILKWLGKMILPMIRKWDYKAAQRPHFFIANSETVKKRIETYYGRNSVVIFPPVDTEAFQPTGRKENYFFAASRLEPYKKIELVVQAFNELGLPLKIAGSGTASKKLKEIAGPNIEFLGRISDQELRRRYSESLAYIFPAEEDAGIMILEAQACGTPVLAYRAGGARETILEGITGEFFDKQDAESIKEVVRKFDPAKYDPNILRKHAQGFDKKIFQERIRKFVEEKYTQFSSAGNADNKQP